MKSHVRLSKRFEYLLVALVAGLVVLVAVDRYLSLGRETQRLGFELLSHNFTAAAANVQVRWILTRNEDGGRDWVEDEAGRIYVNAAGWPRGSQPLPRPLKVEDCEFLWQKLLQNPPPLSLEGGESRVSLRGDARYHVSLRFGEVCRYEMLVGERTLYAFDYATQTGQLMLNYR